ncbi:hypothetical protein PPL_06960 [Heterostelium album PN500]|uniref:Nucleoside diphosphate kinase-like domain-containing protein n=1 Tax=Heterostelium pallidum (strain ATCC 26659 / Pp 5 / PN500) TaxID=670386 RepID=D3BE07_HETP5|nr:hypothetical protein PPL_06960 [Heterostelium album PN500]EFA80138.1 hypothetical protein PPL_06960 [Heterostelium album PN500]|eukprot:XP_020432258.1 hypothetical protein PPL_06960 [Heterostelium album PN500]
MSSSISRYTLAIIKPDILIRQSQCLDSIIQKIETKFNIVNRKQIVLSISEAEQFYNDHRGKFFYERLVGFMSRGPIIPMVLSEKNSQVDSIKSWREFIGPTHAENARKLDCLRGEYGFSDTWNGFHGSGSHDEALNEIKFFFPDFDKTNQ